MQNVRPTDLAAVASQSLARDRCSPNSAVRKAGKPDGCTGWTERRDAPRTNGTEGGQSKLLFDERISRAVNSSSSRDPTKRTRCGATLKSAQRRQPSSGVGMERPRRHLRLALNDGQVGTYRGGRHGPCDLVLANRA